MKILYTRDYWPGFHEGIRMSVRRHTQEHMSDLLLHGLKSIFGTSVVDSPRMWFLYKKDFREKLIRPDLNKVALKEDCFGRGFTITDIFEDNFDDTIDRTDIEKKIETNYFDLIIISRIDYSTPYMEKILDFYPKEKIIIVDGCDQSIIRWEALDKCAIYFKRELFNNSNKLFPISYAMLKEKILYERKEKKKFMGTVIPYNKATYIFDNEKDYYADYASSLFGITQMKGGWDCMRHYEILANRCVPIFKDIKTCPERVCTTLPKSLLVTALNFYIKKSPEWFMETSEGQRFYDDVEKNIHDHFVNNCTTEHLAKYVIDTYHNVINASMVK